MYGQLTLTLATTIAPSGRSGATGSAFTSTHKDLVIVYGSDGVALVFTLHCRILERLKRDVIRPTFEWFRDLGELKRKLGLL